MSQVYLVNNNFQNDYKSIPESFGPRIIITEGLVRMPVEKLFALFHRAFENSTPEDYLVLSGPSLVTAIAFHCWMTLHGSCQALVWNRSSGYTVVQTP